MLLIQFIIVLVGNLRDLPRPGIPEYKHWLNFKNDYGPISSVTVLGQHLILIQDRYVATDLLEQMWSKTSGRPIFEFGSKLCGYEKLLMSLQYNATYRRQRKYIDHQIGSPSRVANFNHIQDVETRRLLLRCLNDPSHIHQHFKTQAGAIILKITYGYSIDATEADPLIELVGGMVENFSKVFVPFHWFVDMIPALQYLPEWVPGTGFKGTARQIKTLLEASATIPYSFVRRQMASGVNRPSYISSLLQSYSTSDSGSLKISKEDEESIVWTAAILYGGGADTTVSSLSSFVLAMLRFPEVQRKAQKEIDQVVGTERLPQFQDRKSLPYIEAIVKEIARWFPVAAISTSHMADEDIVYNGYLIPKGAILLPSTWAIMHDPLTYPNPSVFDPERFLGLRNEPDPRTYAFGYGRRRCPGRHLADDNLFLTITMMLFAFNMRKAVDEQGMEIEPEVQEKTGLINHPGDFPCKLVPRSARHIELIRSIEVDHPWEKSDAELLDMSIGV
ncbi:Cytochrome P450 monooxygenase CLM2 [Cladobotryum mycophilum]|uniref:Cytochrome P450 monooxygenase CLM2 n=1 Tax=Cladobotryum mycophilum TaxID=491253 RepID=A0ABR0T209_9HYPO